MKVKNISSITVKELCEKSDINRGTFYLHYRDVFHMLEEIERSYEEFQDMILSMKFLLIKSRQNQYCRIFSLL